ncbi:MAG TPA: Tex family protein [Parasegetibacter sp.]
MNPKHIELIARELGIAEKQAENTMKLLAEGSTVPFISRYRKEATGNLDEVKIAAVQDLKQRYEEIDQRRAFIIKTITDQEKMTPELLEKLEQTWELATLEDIYLPYKPKRKTRAVMAIEKGLEPLARLIFEQGNIDPKKEAEAFINDKVADIEEALKGARDIIAEWINEDAVTRDQLRNLFTKASVISSVVVSGKEEEGNKYKDYFNFSEPLPQCPSHRILAILRAETEGYIYCSIQPEEESALEIISKQFLKSPGGAAAEQVKMALTDAYKRLLKPSLENEMRAASKQKADAEAIEVFAENLRQLLLAPPLGMKPVIAIDPGYRTGCKIVALDAQCNLLADDVIFPLENNYKKDAAEYLIKDWVNKYNIEAIAIGNGTAGRETEEFVKSLNFDKKVLVFMVNESGASVYSASAAAREEFPDHDVTVRGAVSIGRRLMDPLAELVKIDPKSIGVGQYQHDVNQSQLKQSLDRVVESCVNKVGVNLNTASKHLLAYISGLGPSLAENIVKFRKENGAFRSRKDLLKVPRLGDKAFEQCAGFLRIEKGEHPLDNSAVHPERYEIVEKMATDLNATVEDLLKNQELRKKIPLRQYISEEVGMLTLEDIMKELEKPGRDPRDEISVFEFDPGIKTIEDLREGMILNGIVTNITAFGAFVDIGVKQDGLVHISHLSHQYISNPNEAVKLQQKVKVKVMEVDINRKRIALSVKEATENPHKGQKFGPKRPKTNEDKAPASMDDALAQLKKKFGTR